MQNGVTPRHFTRTSGRCRMLPPHFINPNPAQTPKYNIKWGGVTPTWKPEGGCLEGIGRSKSSSTRFLSFSGAENSKNRALELFRLGQEGLEACGSPEGLGRSKSSSARFLSFSGAQNSKNRALELLGLGRRGWKLAEAWKGLGAPKVQARDF